MTGRQAERLLGCGKWGSLRAFTLLRGMTPESYDMDNKHPRVQWVRQRLWHGAGYLQSQAWLHKERP